MKKLLSLILAAAMLIAALPAAYGADDITVMLDGTKLEFDVQPQIINDRTMVPMRTIFEELGADVSWDGTTSTVTADKDDTEIIMTIGYELMFVNYDTVTLDAPPVIIGDRTLVPLRAIAESFDCTVDWEGGTRTVTITTKDADSASTPAVTSSPEVTSSSEATDNPEATIDPKATATPSASKQSSKSSPTPEATAAPDETDTAATPSSDDTETAMSTAAPTASPADTSENDITDENGETEEQRPQRYSGEYNIVYDDENEKQSHYCSDFTIIDVVLNDDGDYEITYTVKTYRDDSGNVILSFACYDEDGGRVDGFSELFHTWAYSWTEQEAVAVVSSDTTTIKLLLNE